MISKVILFVSYYSSSQMSNFFFTGYDIKFFFFSYLTFISYRVND